MTKKTPQSQASTTDKSPTNKSPDTYKEVLIDIDAANQRFDRFLRKFYKPYTTITLSMIYERIRKGHIRVNDKKAKEETKILLGDIVRINISKTAPLIEGKDTNKRGNKGENKGKDGTNTEKNAHETREMILQHIVSEDPRWLVFNKPPRMLMHPGSGQAQKAITMNDRLYVYLNKNASKDIHKRMDDNLITRGSTFKPAFGYRLDKDTSGVLIAAKTYEALQYLNTIIRERKVSKRYITVVGGNVPKKLVINKPLFKGYHGEKGRAHMFVNYEKGQDSETIVYNLQTIEDKKIGPISLCLVRLMTGRMHQIRIHMTSEGYPVLGDLEYGNANIARGLEKTHGIKRQLLHSFFYSFTDTNGKKKEFFAPIPLDIQNLFPTITEENILQKIKTL